MNFTKKYLVNDRYDPLAHAGKFMPAISSLASFMFRSFSTNSPCQEAHTPCMMTDQASPAPWWAVPGWAFQLILTGQITAVQPVMAHHSHHANNQHIPESTPPAGPW
jgi:hypothetical protein